MKSQPRKLNATLILEAVTLAKKLKICPEWREFKSKWDGKIPVQTSSEYSEYLRDGKRAQTAIENLIVL